MRYHKTVSMETLEQNFNAQLKQLLLNEVTMETLFSPRPPSLQTQVPLIQTHNRHSCRNAIKSLFFSQPKTKPGPPNIKVTGSVELKYYETKSTAVIFSSNNILISLISFFSVITVV